MAAYQQSFQSATPIADLALMGGGLTGVRRRAKLLPMQQITSDPRTYVRAQRGLERVENLIQGIWRTVPEVGLGLYILAVYQGQQADIALAFKLVAALVILRLVCTLGERYATAQRDRHLLAWLQASTGHLLSNFQAASLRRGYTVDISNTLYRINTEGTEPTLVMVERETARV